MIVDTAIRCAQITTREGVKNMAVPFKLLYTELLKEKEIKPINELPREEKLKYWNETSGTRFERIVTWQALYVYDLITK